MPASTRLVVAAAIFCGVVLRLGFLGSDSFWLDETFSVTAVRDRSSVGEIWNGATRTDLGEDQWPYDETLDRVAEMVLDSMSANGLEVDDFISVIFTATSDLVSEFPAYAARQLGFGEVPLLCARELEIAGSMPRVVRMLAHVESDLPRAEITHVYLHGAAALRTDLTRTRQRPDE